MANIPSPTSCDDYLGIDSWRADEDCARKEKRGTASVRTPDLGRGNLGEARPAGPPGSAPLWNEGGDGRYSVTPQSGGEGNGGHGSTRSKDVVQEAWKEVARGGRNAISKATFILIHVEVHRRMEEMSGSGQCDFRSDAEMNWATSSKGRTMMDFQQFDEACLGMTKGIGAAEGTRRQATFYSVLLEACRTIGGDQQDNDPANRPATEGLVRPSVAPPESPLRGSFPAGFGQTISPNDSGRWLLRSARRKENAEPRQGNQREEEDEDRKRSERRGRQQQHPHAASTAGGLSDRLGHGSSCSSPPREGAALVDGGGDGQRATATSMVGGATCADGSSFLVMQKADRLRSWPPAWVKQCADSSSGGDDARDSSESQKTGIVLARGIFAAGSAHATANTGSQVKALDARLLIGSESQKALLLQEELRSNRARLLEIQRHPGRGPTALSQCRTSPRQGTRADEKPDKSRSPTTCAGAGGGGGGASSRDCNFLEDSQRSFPSHQQHCRAHPSAADSHPASCAVNDSAEGSGTAPPESNLCCAALAGYRLSGATCVDIGDNDGDKTFAGRAGPGGGADGVDSLDGSLEGSLSTGSLSTGAGKSRAAAKVAPSREKLIVLPCRLCRIRESALWCAECKLSFCAICFAKVPHHQGTGFLVHDPARESQHQAGSHLPGNGPEKRGVETSRAGWGRGDDGGVGTCLPATVPPPRKAHREPLSSPVSLCSPVTPFGRLMRGRPQSSLLPVRNNTPEVEPPESQT